MAMVREEETHSVARVAQADAASADLSQHGLATASDLGMASAKDETSKANTDGSSEDVNKHDACELGVRGQSALGSFGGTSGQIQEGGPQIYRCTQGILFVK